MSVAARRLLGSGRPGGPLLAARPLRESKSAMCQQYLGAHRVRPPCPINWGRNGKLEAFETPQ
jgi:hypothetical protein